MLGQIFRFGIVGTIGFLVDAGVLRACLSLAGLGPYSGRVISFLFAATTTYLLNRVWTFKAHGSDARRDLPLWLALMSVSALVNYGVYAISLNMIDLVGQWPELGVAFGSVAAMGLNFLAARYIVFRQTHFGPIN